ncbi:hypothetical protein IU459_09435 [Nocardia amamiensis]|uniref:Nephrocystin 3-like N-terminal domain-containing protein n=1 Tax=Nocardia amamiensis TaxID=404578 RepID=A0ABS0CMD0_9NOCA|nr:hypothetical protein [Nocardia amamiensis]MBF6297766.1 hypothetical protein [Nocardia amamiensis]
MNEKARWPVAPIYDFDRVKAGRDLLIHHTDNRYEIGVVSNGALLTGRSLYVSQVREFLAPVDGLRDRKDELDDVAEFCRGEQPYMWIRAEPWAGKSALLSWFTLFPPADMTVIGFFITDRLADQNDHSAFTAAVLDQLAVLMPDQRALIAAATVNRDGLRNELLTLAARREADAGRRLVLVVDGLDEDTGTPPIVTLLPTRPDLNLRVVVASRHGPALPIPHGHPLTATEPYPLTSSPFAANVQAKAVAELDALLRGPDQHRDLLTLITAANGLTASELTELTDMAPYEIDGLLRAVAGRSFRTRTTTAPPLPGGHGDPVYVLAHETLQRTAEERLGMRHLTAGMDRLHSWADHYRDRAWPTDTPDFLLRRYFSVLDRHHDLARMVTAALDTARHDRMRVRTGGDATALSEIRTVQQHICNQPDPDLLSTARLARHRDRLHSRNDNIPTQLLIVMALLGQHDRAEALAHSYSTPHQQAEALTAIIQVVAQTDPERAARLTEHAETIAHTITNRRSQAAALAKIVAVVAGIDPERAEAIAHTISDPHSRASALIKIIKTVATTDPEHAARLTEHAETITHTITDTHHQTDLLTSIALAVDWTDPEHAARLTEHAETIAHTITDTHHQAELLTSIARAVTRLDPERAEAITHTISDPYRQAKTLTSIALAVARTDPEHAARLAEHAETIAHTITEPHHQADLLTSIARAVTRTDPERAARLTERAETIAHTITHPREQANSLGNIAHVVAQTDPERAESIAHTITDLDRQDDALVTVAQVVIRTDLERAQTITHTIADPYRRARALVKIIKMVAPTDPEHAARLTAHTETIADTITSPHQQTNALATIALAVARTDPGAMIRTCG